MPPLKRLPALGYERYTSTGFALENVSYVVDPLGKLLVDDED